MKRPSVYNQNQSEMNKHYDRRNFLQQTGLGLAGLYLGSGLISCSQKTSYAALAAIPAESPYVMKHLRGSVGYFTEKGGTIGWLIDGKNSALVDSQFPEQMAHLLAEASKITDDNWNVLFNTHHHGDHTSGNISLKGKVSAVIAHENSKINQKKAAEQKNNLDGVLLPDTTFAQNYRVKVGKENISCHYFGAAHTNGDSIIHFEDSDVVHIGDLVFNRRFPYIDKGAGASIQGWIGVHDALLRYLDNKTQIICGHAGQGYDVIIGKEDIKAFSNYLERLLVFTRQKISEGVTLEELKKTTTFIPGAEQWQGDGIARSLDAAYVELNGPKG